ncbi:homoserine O-succinyltransferase [Streptococcus urinalis FB127-CNA-2]|uniref:Homoserine O-succinyltransferase domain protein n=1 Tax=Streptococcus urinalis 2285-97 TaxID=764291 RepID=G5KH24_9STRE|nr:homoserine O-succinyltransferase domain protein [Streptococcus urinalis 2285-97]EKS22464.1 homoserine O-succinyltransferase [Streptococcus urinalis FB127-CNA-2]VEF32277.1 homoserine O-succinyltransferase [Streptococcus urinalis]
MPILEELSRENIFAISQTRAESQDIRPLNILILNLMPTKEDTELQLLRLLSNTPLQINVTFLYLESHQQKNTSLHHLESFYSSFSEVKLHYYDGFIVTGAPIEQLNFEEVDYWDELVEVFEWSKSHVFSTLHIC